MQIWKSVSVCLSVCLSFCLSVYIYIPSKGDRRCCDLTYCTKTNKGYLLWESTNTLLSVLFATEACYLIKDNNKEKSFCWDKLTFCLCKLPFCWRKLRKACFALAFFFAGEITNYQITDTNWEKSILRQHFLTEANKFE